MRVVLERILLVVMLSLMVVSSKPYIEPEEEPEQVTPTPSRNLTRSQALVRMMPPRLSSMLLADI